MPETIYVNGTFYPASEAKISVFDHGFLYGDGLFETMRVYRGRMFRLAKHLDRLFKAADELALSVPWSRQELEDIFKEVIRQNGDELNVRLTVTRGTGPAGIDPGLCLRPNLVIMARPIKMNPLIYELGATAVFVKTVRTLAGSVMSQVKSLNFLSNILARQEAVKAGADEGFMLNSAGEVTEGTVSNVFAVTNGVVMTPHLPSGLLPGITRSEVISLAAELGIEVQENVMYPAAFARADEIFYTSSISEIVPVVSLDGLSVGSGRPGAITKKLISAYRKRVRES